MCGIAGRLDPEGTQINDVKFMLAQLRHRGPDSEFMVSDGLLTMGMCRLSIVDIETGTQPYSNETEDVLVVFNGEIYNAPQLRNELVSRGHRFRSRHSDGEVIPHLYEELGPTFARRLEGMFAVAVWDSRERRLTLVRDQFGVKPLFYNSTRRSIDFASEPKALLTLGKTTPTINPQALHAYHRLGYVPGPHTAYEGIELLGPAEGLIWQDGCVERFKYWDPSDAALSFPDMDSAAEAIGRELSRSVRTQMQSDVPVGAFLSGGLDSSAVVALAASEVTTPLTTFALVYPGLESAGKSRDATLAKLVSKIFGTDHVEVGLTAKDFIAGIPDVVRAFDQPFAGAISTFYLSAVAARHVRVALTGDGADELFGSYLFHRTSAWLDWRQLASDSQFLNFGLSEADKATAIASSNLAELRYALALRYSPLEGEGLLYSSEFHDRIMAARRADPMRTALESTMATCPVPKGEWLNRSLLLDQVAQLTDEVLAFSDRLSMAHSLELRPPFLSVPMGEIAAGLQSHWKISPSGVKLALRAALTDILPPEVLLRPKEGFVPPIKDWLGGRLADWVRDTLTEERAALHGTWQFDTVRRLLNAMEREPQRVFKKVWTLAMYQVWWEEYCSIR